MHGCLPLCATIVAQTELIPGSFALFPRDDRAIEVRMKISSLLAEIAVGAVERERVVIGHPRAEIARRHRHAPIFYFDLRRELFDRVGAKEEEEASSRVRPLEG